ncbi:MAG: DUF4923 family protein [Bacteroidales bacterium]|nr:DUF4923 family protein [Bacteroidales bacterium]
MKTIIKSFLLAGALCLAGQTVSAQSLKDLLNKVTGSEAITETVTDLVANITGIPSTVDITGTWTYSGIAVKFESEDFIKSTAASVAAGQVEEKLDSYLAKVGIKSGTFSFTFNKDNTFTTTFKGKNFNGTYELSEDQKSISLTYGRLISLKPFTASVSATSSQFDLLFEADKLLELIGKLTATTNNTALKTIGSLAGQYDGMKLGLELHK